MVELSSDMSQHQGRRGKRTRIIPTHTATRVEQDNDDDEDDDDDTCWRAALLQAIASHTPQLVSQLAPVKTSLTRANVSPWWLGRHFVTGMPSSGESTAMTTRAACSVPAWPTGPFPQPLQTES
eukprot:m.312688 g.312688  ORF g.312688 m.312688 type:complete len:124 (-) comp19660_c1_seq3:962-1333(-)